MSRYRRINFQLPQKLALQFEACAAEKGLTKAKLLRTWLKQGIPDELPYCQSGTPTTFNFRLSDSDLRSIEKKARVVHRIKLSELFRRVVVYYLARESRDYSGYQRLRDSGAIFEKNPLTTDQKLEKAGNLIQAGQLNMAEEILDRLEIKLVAKDRSALVFGEIDLLRGIMARYARDLDGCERMLNRAIQIAQVHNCKSLSSRVCDQIGVLADIREQIDFAIKSTRKMTLIDPQLESTDRFKLRLLNLYALSAHPELKQLLDSIDADSLTSREKQRMVLALIRIGDYESAGQLLEQISGSISIKESKYLLENRGAIGFQRRDFESAYNDFVKAELLEAQLRSTPSLSKAKLYRLIIEGMWGSDAAWRQAEWMVENQHRPTYQSMGQYLIAAARWSQGNDSARRKLSKLQGSDSTARVRRLAKKSLDSKEIFPLV